MYKEKPIEKIYWTIGEAAEIVGVAPSCIRYWLKEFDMDGEVKRSNSRNYRKLTVGEIETLAEIKRLVQVEGLRLWAAKKRLNAEAAEVLRVG